MDSRITSKGQITIPNALREHLGVKAGDQIQFFVHPNGSVVLLPTRPVQELRGILRRWARRGAAGPASIDEMREAEQAGALRLPERRARTRTRP